MAWRPIASVATLRQRAHLLRTARHFLTARGLMEVDTPALVSHAVTDPHLQNIPAQLAGGRQLYLHTSPEFHMKRLLAAGAPDIWQLGKVFRDGEAGRHHEPEFTLLEWYRRGFSLQEMAAETCELLVTLAAEAHRLGASPAIGADPPVIRTYSALFRDSLGIDPLTADGPALRDCACAELGAAVVGELAGSLGEDPGLWLDLLMSHVIGDRLGTEGLVVVTGYPAAQAALARLDPADPRVAERFEVFCRGVEVANGYRELTDADEQRRRFAQDRQLRARYGRPDVVPDEKLLAALEDGLPDCAGVAVGFDRVVMLLLGLDTLQEAISFPVLAG
jgi:lysyl-tRNA synthetase class 2